MMIIKKSLPYLLLLLPTICFSQKSTIDLTHLLKQFYDFSSLPKYEENTYCAEVSTYDPTGGNDDGFSGTYSFLRKNADSSLVIFEQKGPGVINRIWTPTPSGDTLDFYIDDILLSDEFLVVPDLSEEAIIGAATMQKWRIKLDFEYDNVHVDPKVGKLQLI